MICQKYYYRYIFHAADQWKYPFLVFNFFLPSPQQVCVLNGGHQGPVQCVQFNPCYMMMASACSQLNMWLPNLTQAERDEAGGSSGGAESDP